MEKSRISGMRSGSKPLIVITTAIILSIIIMISLFIIYFNKVYSSVLEKDMEQIEWTSHYVTKLIHTEIQHSVDILQASEEIFHASEGTGEEGGTRQPAGNTGGASFRKNRSCQSGRIQHR